MGYIGHLIGVYGVQGEIRWKKMWNAPGTAITVSLIEEWLFRGVLLGLCLRTMSTPLAIGYISALFSILHFLKPIEEGLEITRVQWTTGFAMLPHIFHQFVEPLLVLSGFTTLLAIAIVLSLTRIRTASLWMPIGLHAGLIFGNRIFNIAFKQVKEIEPAWLTWFYGERIEIGIAPLITVVIIGAVSLWYLRKREPVNDALMTK
jgi:membrane protease YdiL (CAAX protease family)